MVPTKYNDVLPDWVREVIPMECPYCGCFIIDNSDKSGKMTARKCANPKCPGHMSYKIDYLAKKFEVQGFGPATALTYIRQYKFQSHLEILPVWYGDVKPTKRLGEIADLACIDGFGGTAGEKELNSYSSFMDYFRRANPVNPILYEHWKELVEAEKYFTVASPLSQRKMYVMATGSFSKFSSREEFFNEVNEAFGQFVQVIQTGVRKTGVSYLIKEANAPDRTKSRIAREYNIPVVTPTEFVNILDSTYHIQSGGKDENI